METYSGELVLCLRGLHASTRLIDAINHAPGVILRRVRCSGRIEQTADKLVCTERQILGTADINQLILDFVLEFGMDHQKKYAVKHHTNGDFRNLLVYVRDTHDTYARAAVNDANSFESYRELFVQAQVMQECWLLEQIRIRYPELAVELPPA